MIGNISLGFVFIFDGSASVFILCLILKNIFVNKVYGLTFWLLILLEIAVISIVVYFALSLKFDMIIEKYGSDISDAINL